MIREAVHEDWPHIYPFFAETVAAGETYAYPEDLTSEQAQALWMQPPPWRTIVAVEDEQVLGSAILGPNRPGRGSHVATASFMVAPAAQGRGVGRALARHVLELARAAGYRAMQFNAVVETNHAAVALWRSLGFTILATVPEAFDHPATARRPAHHAPLASTRGPADLRFAPPRLLRSSGRTLRHTVLGCPLLSWRSPHRQGAAIAKAALAKPNN
jgi:L-amino acid N-acyltransferase YncA